MFCCNFYCSGCFHISHCAVASAAGLKDERGVEMLLSQRQSWTSVLWPDCGKLEGTGGEGVLGCDGIIIQAPTHTHTHTQHRTKRLKLGVTNREAFFDGWVIYRTSTKSARRKMVRFNRCSGPLLVLVTSGVLPSSSPLGRSLKKENWVYSQVCWFKAWKQITCYAHM